MDVAIVGAGPHGLSAAARLRRAGIAAEAFGEPMAFWRSMPRGMSLRSNMSATNLVAPSGPLSLEAYMAESGERLAHPMALRHFVDYGLWVQRKCLPDLDQRLVRDIVRDRRGFSMCLSDGSAVTARRVVVACGIGGFAWIPAAFRHLPSGQASHTSQLDNPGAFAGRRVVVVGAGQSAFECAVLMAERGAEVELLCRASEPVWLRSWSPIHFLGPLGRIVYAPTDVGPLWYSRLVATPALFTRLPREVQHRIANRCIRPACSYVIKVRVDAIKLSTGIAVVGVDNGKDGLQLRLSDGSRRSADHVMFGTGYKVDVRRYPFLGTEILSGLRTADGYPVLAAGLESSVPGLHFMGAAAQYSFGPTMRFVSGSWYGGARVTETIAAQLRSTPRVGLVGRRQGVACGVKAR